MSKLISTDQSKQSRVIRAARMRFPRRKLQSDFEHGQWWITLVDNGAQFSVVDAEGANTYLGLDFEQVTEGED